MILIGLFGKIHEDMFGIIFPEHIILADNIWSIFEMAGARQAEGWKTRIPSRLSGYTWFENNYGSYLAIIGYTEIDICPAGMIKKYTMLKANYLKAQHQLKEKEIAEIREEMEDIARLHDEILDKISKND